MLHSCLVWKVPWSLVMVKFRGLTKFWRFLCFLRSNAIFDLYPLRHWKGQNIKPLHYFELINMTSQMHWELWGTTRCSQRKINSRLARIHEMPCCIERFCENNLFSQNFICNFETIELVSYNNNNNSLFTGLFTTVTKKKKILLLSLLVQFNTPGKGLSRGRVLFTLVMDNRTNCTNIWKTNKFK